MGSFPGSWQAARMADLTLDLHTFLSQGSSSLRFHSRGFLSVIVFKVILDHPGPHFPSICMLQTVFIAPLDSSTSVILILMHGVISLADTTSYDNVLFVAVGNVV